MLKEIEILNILTEKLNRYNISSTDFVLSRVDRLYKRTIDFDVYLPSRKKNLQREKVWTLLQKRELIKSILIGRNINHISVLFLIPSNETDNDIIQIIDGKQRLTTIIDFFNNEFTLKDDGKHYYYRDLPENYRKIYAKHNIHCQAAYDDYNNRFTEQEKVDWFYLLNFAGTPQDKKHFESLNIKE